MDAEEKMRLRDELRAANAKAAEDAIKIAKLEGQLLEAKDFNSKFMDLRQVHGLGGAGEGGVHGGGRETPGGAHRGGRETPSGGREAQSRPRPRRSMRPTSHAPRRSC
ncbi:hypothetical protein SEVIR_4G203300v4 [Setaria viridis]|uniref:Uncharacterized protein n=2 Tax=Setaria TaxID=4554 RepID=A0A368QW35_SETIT|nr:hypothetical protein SETIT_4G193500v2 [Setaria italica]TKW22047.1 hypothetical protein SEVIR_4G203300v2 [Setaria viridis]